MSARVELTDAEREVLLTPCECGHTINDHGSLLACWLCEEDNRECSKPFEALLVERIETIVTTRVHCGRSSGNDHNESHPTRW